jgi:hypothetical protein
MDRLKSNIVRLAYAVVLMASFVPPAAATHRARRFYAADSFWNTPIGPHPQIEADSAAIVARAITAYRANATFSNREDWGMPVAYATPSSRVYRVACTIYCTGDVVDFRIPPCARVATGSDGSLVVIDGDRELDMWVASYDPTSDKWSAGTRVVNDLNGWGATCGQKKHCNGGTAAGFAALGGVVRPEEIGQGHIDHALALITPLTRAGYIACPATHTDGKSHDPAAIPEGARVQLDPSLNVDAQPWPAWEKIIARALQIYGAYVVDTSGALALRGATDQNPGSPSWASVGVPNSAPMMSDFPWERFRVLKFSSCN